MPRAASAQSVAGEGGPVSEISRDLRGDSRPVHERANTVTAGSVGPVHSRSVHDGPRRTMLSGPVTEISRGPVSRAPMTGDVSVHQASSGAVKEEMARMPVGEAVAVRELDALQNRLREMREQVGGAGVDPLAESQPSLEGSADGGDDAPQAESAEEQSPP
jgi:hypothetical protein